MAAKRAGNLEDRFYMLNERLAVLELPFAAAAACGLSRGDFVAGRQDCVRQTYGGLCQLIDEWPRSVPHSDKLLLFREQTAMKIDGFVPRDQATRKVMQEVVDSVDRLFLHGATARWDNDVKRDGPGQDDRSELEHAINAFFSQCDNEAGASMLRPEDLITRHAKLKRLSVAGGIRPETSSVLKAAIDRMETSEYLRPLVMDGSRPPKAPTPNSSKARGKMPLARSRQEPRSANGQWNLPEIEVMKSPLYPDAHIKRDWEDALQRHGLTGKGPGGL